MQDAGRFYLNLRSKSKTPVCNHFGRHGTQMQTIKSRCLIKVGHQRTRRTCRGRHSYEATPEERGRWQRNWKIVLNTGVQGPIRQRPEFREAKDAYRRLYKEHVESTGQRIKSIHPAQHRRQNSQQQQEGAEEYTYTVQPRTGWTYYPATSSSSSSQWQQNNEWKSNQRWDYWRSSTWTEQKTFNGRNHKHMEVPLWLHNKK